MNYIVTYETMRKGDICPILEAIVYIVADPQNPLVEIYAELHKRFDSVFVSSYIAEDDDYFMVPSDCWD